IERIKVLLPITSDGRPDYLFMEACVKKYESHKIKKYKNYIIDRIKKIEIFKKVKPLDEKKWVEFELENIFIIKSGKRLTKADMKVGNTPFIGATDSNNGITEF